MKIFKIAAALLVSLLTICPVDVTILATSGHLLALSPFRELFIQSGLSHGNSKHARALYDLSGFRSVSDQGVGERKAATLTHEVREISGQQRSEQLRRVKRDYPMHKERVYLEQLFSLLQQMDSNSCISRLLCEVGFDPQPFGFIGHRIFNYLRSVPPVTWNSSPYPFLEAFKWGNRNGKSTCRDYFESCIYDLQKIMDFLWHVFHHPL